MTRLCRLGATEGDLSHASAAKLLSKDEARRMAANIAKLRAAGAFAADVIRSVELIVEAGSYRFTCELADALVVPAGSRHIALLGNHCS